MCAETLTNQNKKSNFLWGLTQQEEYSRNYTAFKHKLILKRNQGQFSRKKPKLRKKVSCLKGFSFIKYKTFESPINLNFGVFIKFNFLKRLKKKKGDYFKKNVVFEKIKEAVK